MVRVVSMITGLYSPFINSSDFLKVITHPQIRRSKEKAPLCSCVDELRPLGVKWGPMKQWEQEAKRRNPKMNPMDRDSGNLGLATSSRGPSTSEASDLFSHNWFPIAYKVGILKTGTPLRLDWLQLFSYQNSKGSQNLLPVLKKASATAARQALHTKVALHKPLFGEGSSPPSLARLHHHPFLELLLTSRHRNSLCRFAHGSVVVPPMRSCDHLCPRLLPPLNYELIVAIAHVLLLFAASVSNRSCIHWPRQP